MRFRLLLDSGILALFGDNIEDEDVTGGNVATGVVDSLGADGVSGVDSGVSTDDVEAIPIEVTVLVLYQFTMDKLI